MERDHQQAALYVEMARRSARRERENDSFDLMVVLRRTCVRLEQKKGKCTLTVSYALTSLSSDEARAADLERRWCGHWAIENRKHYVGDTLTFIGIQPTATLT